MAVVRSAVVAVVVVATITGCWVSHGCGATIDVGVGGRCCRSLHRSWCWLWVLVLSSPDNKSTFGSFPSIPVDVFAVGIRHHRGTTSSILLVSSDLVLGDGAHPMLCRVVEHKNKEKTIS